MERYWDLTEVARAELSSDDVKRYLDVELMEHGVVRPKPVELQQLAEIVLPKIKVAVVYGKGRYGSEQICGFRSAEQAQAFLALEPISLAHEYDADVEAAHRIGMDAEIKFVDVVEHAFVLNALIELKANKSKKDANVKAEEEFRKAARLMEEATRGVWDDWQQCRDRAAAHRKLLETRAEYIKLAGNENTALVFLKKAYTEQQIIAADEWARSGTTPDNYQLPVATEADPIAL